MDVPALSEFVLCRILECLFTARVRFLMRLHFQSLQRTVVGSAGLK